MAHLRLVLRGCALLLSLLVGMACVVTGVMVLFASPRRAMAWRRGVFRHWSRLALPLLGVRLTVTGQAPAGGFLLVANHLSYIDIPVLASKLEGVFVAKQEVRSWPLFGLACHLVDTIFIDRGSRRGVLATGAAMQAHLDRGIGVVFFPEGTSTDGTSVAPFRPSLLEPAAATSLPVHVAALSYRTPDDQPPARDAVCWWGDIEFVPHFLGLLRLSSIEARLDFAPEPIVDSDRKRLAARLEGAVREAAARLRDEHAPAVDAAAARAVDTAAATVAEGSP